MALGRRDRTFANAQPKIPVSITLKVPASVPFVLYYSYLVFPEDKEGIAILFLSHWYMSQIKGEDASLESL